MNITYSYMIIDDDTFARETLADLLAEIPQLRLLKTISESGMAIKYLATLRPDLVFLDINMPNKTGIDILKEIMDLGLSSKVIFTTAHEEYVLEAFKNRAFDYLIKPINKKELSETLARFYEQMNNAPRQIGESNKTIKADDKREIIIRNAYGTLIFKPNDIFYVEADGAYTIIYLINEKKELISKNIGKIEYLFSNVDFFKISRSHIINLRYLIKTDRVNRKVLLRYNNKNIELKISREQLYDLEQAIHSKAGDL